MAIDFTIKSGDTLNNLRVTLMDANGAVDLSAVTAVTFNMAKVTGRTPTLVIDHGATIFPNPPGDGSDGTVQYNWQPGDTDDPGNFIGEFEVEFSPGNVKTFPNNKDLTILIFAQVA